MKKLHNKRRLSFFQAGCTLLLLTIFSSAIAQKEEKVKLNYKEIEERVDRALSDQEKIMTTLYKSQKKLSENNIPFSDIVDQVLGEKRKGYFITSKWEYTCTRHAPFTLSISRRPRGTSKSLLEKWDIDIETEDISFFLNPEGERKLHGKYTSINSGRKLSKERIKELDSYFAKAHKQLKKAMLAKL